jgi:hypothetical protein
MLTVLGGLGEFEREIDPLRPTSDPQEQRCGCYLLLSLDGLAVFPWAAGRMAGGLAGRV